MQARVDVAESWMWTPVGPRAADRAGLNVEVRDCVCQQRSMPSDGVSELNDLHRIGPGVGRSRPAEGTLAEASALRVERALALARLQGRDRDSPLDMYRVRRRGPRALTPPGRSRLSGRTTRRARRRSRTNRSTPAPNKRPSARPTRWPPMTRRTGRSSASSTRTCRPRPRRRPRSRRPASRSPRWTAPIRPSVDRAGPRSHWAEASI